MAGIRWRVPSPEMQSISAGTQYLLTLSPATNVRLLLAALEVSIRGTSATDEPFFFEWCKCSAAGSAGGTGAAMSPLKTNTDDHETLQFAGAWGRTDATAWTTNPTVSAVYDNWYCHPQGNRIDAELLKAPIPLVGGSIWALRVTAATAKKIVVRLRGEE